MMQGRDKYPVSRLESFSDAVFALSATFLIVSLDFKLSLEQLLHSFSGIFAFALSFTMLVFLWTQHNSFFRRYGIHDRTILLWNSIFLFVVLFYVHPLRFLAEALATVFFQIDTNTSIEFSLRNTRLLFVIYSGGFVVVFLCLSQFYLHAVRSKHKSSLSWIEEFDAITSAQFHTVFVLVGLFSLILAVFNLGVKYGLPGWIYMVLGPALYLHGRLRRKKRDQLEVEYIENTE